MASVEREPIISRLHDRANIEQTSSKCIQNTRAIARHLFGVCSTFAQRLLLYVSWTI